MRELTRPGSKAHGKDIVEGVTVIECPKMVGVGLVGYQRTPGGLRAVSTLWAASLGKEFLRRYYKNWAKSKKKAFGKHAKAVKDQDESGETESLKERKAKIL